MYVMIDYHGIRHTILYLLDTVSVCCNCFDTSWYNPGLLTYFYYVRYKSTVNHLNISLSFYNLLTFY